MPKVSVIVPNYNHAQYLNQRIDSILTQSFQDFELILLDDCSTDNSREVLLSYRDHPKVSHCILNEQNSGSPFRQWNKGIELAEGDYVWIAESDDWAEPDFLKCLLEEMQQHDGVGFAYALARYQLNGTEPYQLTESGDAVVVNGMDFIRKNLVYTNIVYNVSMCLFEKKLYYSINNSLYENMRLCGDWYFYVLLCERTNVIQLNKILSNYRMHSTNTSSKEEILGKSVLEGIDILDYILKHVKGIPLLIYAPFWARQWVKYSNKYHFPDQTTKIIRNRMMTNHKMIVFFYFAYRVYYSIKGR